MKNKINFKDYEVDWRESFRDYQARYYDRPYMYLDGDEVSYMAEAVEQYGWDDGTLIDSFPDYHLTKLGLQRARNAGRLKDYLEKKFYAADKAHDNYRYLLPWPDFGGMDIQCCHSAALIKEDWATYVARDAFYALEDFLGGPNEVANLFNDGRGGSLRFNSIEFSWNGIGGADVLVFGDSEQDYGYRFPIKLDDDNGYYVAC